MTRFDLTNRTALITGAAGLLGIQHASALLEVGAQVILTDLDLDSLKNLKSRLLGEFDSSQIVTLAMDVTSELDVYTAYNQLKQMEIYVDILVNNAAINPAINGDKSLTSGSRLEEYSLSSWNKEIAVGLTGSFLCSKVFGTSMHSRNVSGVIINICSDLAVIAPDQRLYRNLDLPSDQQPVKPVTYSVIKAGLHGLTRYLSTYWLDSPIRCNSLSPGGVFSNQPEAFVRDISSRVPLGRMAHIDEYRASLQFLASDASSYMTGQNLVVDGGRTVW